MEYNIEIDNNLSGASDDELDNSNGDLITEDMKNIKRTSSYTEEMTNKSIIDVLPWFFFFSFFQNNKNIHTLCVRSLDNHVDHHLGNMLKTLVYMGKLANY